MPEVDGTSIRAFRTPDGSLKHLQLWGAFERASGRFIIHFMPEANTKLGAVGPPESLDRVVATGATANFMPNKVLLLADGAKMYPRFAKLIKAIKLLQCSHAKGNFHKDRKTKFPKTQKNVKRIFQKQKKN